MRGRPGLGAVRRWHGSAIEIAVAVQLVAFGVFVILCNGSDWDAFLSFSEVDRRSWVLDHRPPLWSYQFCAGVTRIGDPQAFGLSPLFLLVILFGSFWGTKLAVLASAGVGVYFTTRLLALFANFGAGARAPHSALLTLATLFVTGNFFLWHLLVGHFTFISFFFGLGIVFYTLEGYLRGLGRRDFLIGTLVAWQHYSGGFFHSTAYLLVPFFIALALFAAARALTREAWRGIARAASFHLCGLLLASYKLIAVWQQQQSNPRSLLPANEQSSLAQLLAYQLVPTLGSDWLLPLETGKRWGVHEYSAFSLVPFALAWLALQVASAWRRARSGGRATHPPRHPLAGLVALYAVISAALVLGNFAEAAPFPLVNRLLMQGSVRIVGRFGVGVTLALTLACALALRRLGGAGLGRQACLLLLLASVLNLATFSWMASPSSAVQLASLPSEPKREMSILLRIPPFGPGSQMYPKLRNGVGVINCYNALPRRIHSLWPPAGMHRLIDERYGSPSPRCIEESRFTQSELAIAESCPEFVCLNLDAINVHDPPDGVRYDRRLRRLCRVREKL